MTARYGCTDCGRVCDFDDEFCRCFGTILPLANATEVLAFKLRHEGREDEALAVEQRAAVIEEHTR